MESTVEVLDPRFGSWMMGAPMTTSRGYFGSFVLGEKIYAVGGMQDRQILDVVSYHRDTVKIEFEASTGIMFF